MTPAVRLGDVVRCVSGGTPARSVAGFYGGDIPWITGADISAEGSVSARSFITSDAVAKSATSVLPAGTVALVTRTSVGKVGVFDLPTAFSQDITALTPSERVSTPYLVHFLRASAPSLARKARGATIKGVTRADVEDLTLPLPPIEEQRRIAAILDQAGAIRTKRRQALAHLDALAQSTFHAMFGDPSGGAWECAPLGEVVERIDSGTSPNCEARPADPTEWGVLKLGAVTYGTFRPGENKAYLGQVGGMSLNEVRPGDVLMTRKNTRELVGAVAVVGDVRPRLLLPDLVFRLELDRARVDRQYFQAMMMSGRVRAAVRGLSSGSAASMPNISKARLRTLAIGLPPLRLQRQFGSRVAAINAQRALLERALAVDEELFASLQSRAFRGEL